MSEYKGVDSDGPTAFSTEPFLISPTEKLICTCGHLEEDHEDIPNAAQIHISIPGYEKVTTIPIKQSKACIKCDCPGFGVMAFATRTEGA